MNRRSVSARAPAAAPDETCAHPWCSKPLVIPSTGRRPRFCSDRCRKHAHALVRQAEAREAAEAAAAEFQRRRARELRELAIDVAELGYMKTGTVDAIHEWLVEELTDRWPGGGERELVLSEMLAFVRRRRSSSRTDGRRRR